MYNNIKSYLEQDIQRNPEEEQGQWEYFGQDDLERLKKRIGNSKFAEEYYNIPVSEETEEPYGIKHKTNAC